jgi:hypothetical protein
VQQHVPVVGGPILPVIPPQFAHDSAASIALRKEINHKTWPSGLMTMLEIDGVPTPDPGIGSIEEPCRIIQAVLKHAWATAPRGGIGGG